MATAPRIRQLRRDKLIFNLAIRTIRLHLEEESRLLHEPHLRQAPDADLQLVQQFIDHWVGLASEYIRRKFQLPHLTALQLLGALQAELKRSILPQELARMSLTEAMSLPPELVAPAPPATDAGEQQEPAAPGGAAVGNQ